MANISFNGIDYSALAGAQPGTGGLYGNAFVGGGGVLPQDASGHFANRFLQLSRCDGVHDYFKNYEYSYYFPVNTFYDDTGAGARGPVPTIPAMQAACFGSPPGDVPAQNAEEALVVARGSTVGSAVVAGEGQVPLIPSEHGLATITNPNGMGYKYGSLQRTSAGYAGGLAKAQAHTLDGNAFEQTLQNLGLIAGQTIYLFVDVPCGLYSLLNAKTTNLYQFTTVFNRATITDPAPNTIPQISNTQKKPNQFYYANRGRASAGSVKKVKFAIDDLKGPDIIIDGFENAADYTTGIDFDDKESMISRTFVSKYKICLSYCQPGSVDAMGKGPNPKKMKALLLVYDIQNGRIRTMDSKACEKKSSALEGRPVVRTWFTKMKDRIKKSFNIWLGDATGGTHSLGKKSGDWLQVVQSINPNIKIHELTAIQNPVIGNKVCFYGQARDINANAVRAIVTHDRNEKTYALLNGAPMVIFKNAGWNGRPQFYEIYVKNYLTQITQVQYNQQLAEYTTQRQLYNERLATFIAERDAMTTVVNDILNGLTQQVSRIRTGVFVFPDYNQQAVKNLLTYYNPQDPQHHPFDAVYINIITLLNYVRVILKLSEVESINGPANLPNSNLDATTWDNAVAIANANPPPGGGQTYLRNLINQLSIDINKYRTEIDNINRLLRIQHKNVDIVNTINHNLNQEYQGLLESPQIVNNCAIFRYKKAQTGTVIQKQLFIHENVGYAFLESIAKTDKALQDGTERANNLGVLAAWNALLSAFQTGRQYLYTTIHSLLAYHLDSITRNEYYAIAEYLSTDAGGGYRQFNAMRTGRGYRRLSVKNYLAYVILNLKEANKYLGGEASYIMNGGGKGKRAKRKWQSVKVVTQRVGPRREISFRQITTEAERMKALQTMRRVLYNYSTVFENYITFNLIELNNSDGLTENDFNYGFPECYTGAANNNRKIITPFITWLNNQNVKLINRVLGVQARRLYDENGEPLFLPGHGENYPSPGNKNAYLLALDPPLDVLASSEAPSIPINLMREGNKENMIKTLFPVAVTDAGGRAPVPSTVLYETNVNNIDLYIADVLEGNTMVRSRGFAASYIQKCRNQAKNIEFLRYLVNNRKENEDGTGLQTTPAGAFKYNEPDSGWNQVTPWDDFIVRGGGINKQTRKRRNKKKKSRRKKKQRRRKTIKRRRKRGRKSRRKR